MFLVTKMLWWRNRETFQMAKMWALLCSGDWLMKELRIEYESCQKVSNGGLPLKYNKPLELW